MSALPTPRSRSTTSIRRTCARALVLATGGLLLAGCTSAAPDNVAVGTIEMVEIDVGPLQPGRVRTVRVAEGDMVRAGDTLAIFTSPTLAAAEAQARARVDAAQAGASEAMRGARPAEILRAEADLRASAAEAERTAADVARLAPLAAKGDVSAAQFAAARAAASVAAGRRDAASNALRLLQEGTRAERKAMANADVRGATAAAAVIRATADDMVLLSPVDGVITSRNIEPGEVLSPGQSALTIGQPQRPWARIYVSQFVVPQLHVGDTLTAQLDGDSAVYRGRVVSIASKAEFTPRVALTEQERADLLFAIKVDFVDQTDRLRAGLPVTVRLPARAK
ncbi:MAG: HlyD family efflux transporter periplasmic adaptor subunit [Gemmatimonadaceae bacterium]|nr:HlyD family efflux transporter periplasmic adaptor subunit [Gemmatimonadaceae bacterium]